jgi:hypothetical protein
MQRQSTRRSRPPVWYGTQQEAADLVTAALHYCTCVVNDGGKRTTLCPPHAMVFTDQRALNGLLFARRLSGRFRAEEFDMVERAPVA